MMTACGPNAGRVRNAQAFRRLTLVLTLAMVAQPTALGKCSGPTSEWGLLLTSAQCDVGGVECAADDAAASEERAMWNRAGTLGATEALDEAILMVRTDGDIGFNLDDISSGE